MTREFKQLLDEIDSYLKERTTMDSIDRELILRLKDHMVGQDRMIEGLVQDRENLILNRR